MTATLTFQKSIEVPYMCKLLNIQNVVTTLIPYRGITSIPFASKLVRPAHLLVLAAAYFSRLRLKCLRLGITASEEALPVRLRGSRRSYQVARQFFGRLVTGLQAAPGRTLFGGSRRSNLASFKQDESDIVSLKVV